MGVRRGRHVTHRRAQSGWQSLTPSEQAVVDLVAEGLSNPRSASGCTSHAGRCKPISRTCSPSSTSPPAPSSPPRQFGTGGNERGTAPARPPPEPGAGGRPRPAPAKFAPHPRRRGRLPDRPGPPVLRPVRSCADLRARRSGPDRSRYQPAGRCLPGRCRRTLATQTPASRGGIHDAYQDTGRGGRAGRVRGSRLRRRNRRGAGTPQAPGQLTFASQLTAIGFFTASGPITGFPTSPLVPGDAPDS